MQDKLASVAESSSDANSNTTTTTSSSTSSCLLHTSKRSKPNPKFKGLVPQSNGHWGAQIYCNHKRFWIGTFNTQEEAALAYDSAAIKLRSGDSHRNFPWTTLTIQEPHFQNLYSTDAILKMIKDGSYPCKFNEFLNKNNVEEEEENNNDDNDNNQVGDPLLSPIKNEGFSCRQLFEKELTVSDVGKLNRLVIPKKYALKYFPRATKENDVLELALYDRLMKEWKFRYCYWTSSQSYVFTRGWSRFVKDNDLKAKDVVTFYKCEYKQGANKGSSFFMIDDNNTRDKGGNVNDDDQYVAPAETDLCLELTLGNNVQVEKKDDNPGGGGGGGGGGGTRLFGVRIG